MRGSITVPSGRRCLSLSLSSFSIAFCDKLGVDPCGGQVGHTIPKGMDPSATQGHAAHSLKSQLKGASTLSFFVSSIPLRARSGVSLCGHRSFVGSPAAENASIPFGVRDAFSKLL